MGKWTLPPTGGHMDKPDKIYFQTMTKHDVEERLTKNDLIVIPLGSTENHGAAGPYGEDTFIVTRIAEEFAKATGCTVAHPICYGSHPYHHLGQPGTVIISDDVYSDFLRAVMAGFWNTGFRKQIFISLHGQEYIVPSAINEFGKRYQVPALILFLDLPRIMGQTLMDKAHGGPYDNPALVGIAAFIRTWQKGPTVPMSGAVVAGAKYPDGGSSAEVYTQSDPQPYVELEMLGPIETVQIGDAIERVTTYTLKHRITPSPGAEIERFLKP